MTNFLTTFRTRQLLCQTLLDLTDQQHAKAGARDFGAVVEILERKDRVLSRLKEGQVAVDAWRSGRHGLTASEKAECDALLDSCEAALRNLLEATESDAKAMTELRTETLTQIRSVSDGATTHSEYGTATALAEPPPSRLNVSH